MSEAVELSYNIDKPEVKNHITVNPIEDPYGIRQDTYSCNHCDLDQYQGHSQFVIVMNHVRTDHLNFDDDGEDPIPREKEVTKAKHWRGVTNCKSQKDDRVELEFVDTKLLVTCLECRKYVGWNTLYKEYKEEKQND